MKTKIRNGRHYGGRRHTLKKTNKIETRKLHRNDIKEIISDYINKIRYFDLGAYHYSAGGYAPCIVKITPTDITYTYIDDSDLDLLKKGKPLREIYTKSKCKKNTLQYEKLFLINHSEPVHKSDGYTFKIKKIIPTEKEFMAKSFTEKDYMKNIFKLIDSDYYDNKFDNIYYILVKLDSNRYLSLNSMPFTFDIPDDDEIIYVIDMTIQTGYDRILLIGRVNTYIIDDYHESGHLAGRGLKYIANETMKKYLPLDATMKDKIKFIYEGGVDYDKKGYPGKPYLYNGEEKYHKKVFGKKLPIEFTKRKKIYDVLQTLDVKPL